MWWAPTTLYNDEGRLNYDPNANAWYYEYALRDHLGNTRVVFADKNGDGIVDPFSEVSQINHYSPFGMNLEGNWNGGAGKYKHQFNDKEFNDDLGLNWNDFGGRWYDPTFARWIGMDPHADSYEDMSPYTALANNPVSVIDPDGMDIIIISTNGSLDLAIKTLKRTKTGKALWNKYYIFCLKILK